MTYLSRVFPCAALHTTPLTDDEVLEIIRSPDHHDKASGYPWNTIGCATKGQVVDKWPDFRACSDSILSSTLKPELRPLNDGIVADARFFRPQAVHDYAEGLQLFDRMNNYIAEQLFVSPVFVKFQTPGRDLTTLYTMLHEFSPDGVCDADAKAFDANFPLWAASVICEWRIRMGCDAERTRAYYSRMYNGVTLAGGHLFPLVGNPSGHVNTTIDNCLLNMMLMFYAAQKLQWTADGLMYHVLYFVCGDDLIWADRSGRMTARHVADCYFELGISLEFTSLDYRTVFETTFVGTYPVEVGGVIRYYGREPKLRASVLFNRKNSTYVDKVMKAAMCSLLLRFSPEWDSMRTYARGLIIEGVKAGYLSSTDPAVGSYYSLLTDETSAQMYDRLEGSFFYFHNKWYSLKFTPFKDSDDADGTNGSDEPACTPTGATSG